MNKTALLFPGQGSQFVGMGKSLCENFSSARQVFEEASYVLGFDIKKLCHEGDIEELTRTENTQPAILTSSVAAFKVYMEEIGIKPLYCAGHSLGEFSALTCSGAIEFQDAVKIVNKRGKFMQDAVPIGAGAMAAVTGIDQSVIEEECRKVSTSENLVVVSNYNSPEQIVISGHKNAVGQIEEILNKKGARVIPLKVSAPFHSPLMQPAAERLKQELQEYTYKDMDYPVISNVTALPYRGKEDIVENLSLQITKAVRWQDSMRYLQQNGIEIVIDIGPQSVLKNLMKKNASDIKAYSFDRPEDEKQFKDSLLTESKQFIDTKQSKTRLIERCIAIVVCTQNKNWNNDEYQQGVVEPYNKVRKMMDTLKKEDREPTISEMSYALDMLRTVFITKKTPIEEQIDRFEQIFNETGLRKMFLNFKMPAL